MTRFSAVKPQPHRWKMGPDPLLREQYLVWLQQRNQANWRGEPWNLPFESWLKIWQPMWHLRGRTLGTYCMTRINWDEPWSVRNVELIDRREHNRRQRERQIAGEVSQTQQQKRRRLGIPRIRHPRKQK
jgi:hypothetical protein